MQQIQTITFHFNHTGAGSIYKRVQNGLRIVGMTSGSLTSNMHARVFKGSKDDKSAPDENEDLILMTHYSKDLILPAGTFLVSDHWWIGSYASAAAEVIITLLVLTNSR